MLEVVVASLVLSLFALGAFLNLSLLASLEAALKSVSAESSEAEGFAPTGTWRDVLQLDDEEFHEAFWGSARRCATPRRLLTCLYPSGAWALALAVLALAGLWWRVLRFDRVSLLYLTSAAVPLLIGIAMFPSRVRETLSAIADAGLSSAGLIGSGMAEAAAVAIAGCVVSLVVLPVTCLATWAVNRRGGAD